MFSWLIVSLFGIQVLKFAGAKVPLVFMLLILIWALALDCWWINVRQGRKKGG